MFGVRYRYREAIVLNVVRWLRIFVAMEFVCLCYMERGLQIYASFDSIRLFELILSAM